MKRLPSFLHSLFSGIRWGVPQALALGGASPATALVSASAKVYIRAPIGCAVDGAFHGAHRKSC